VITVDTAKLEADIAAFNSRLKARFTMLGGRMPIIVKRQAGYLCRTLINLTPPRDRDKTAEKITNQVNKRFATFSTKYETIRASKKAGHGDTRWYAFSPTAIYGVAKKDDLRDATSEQLYQLYFKRQLNKDGRFQAGKRGKQAVYLMQRIMTKKSTVNKLIARLVKHIGRFKAGWSIGWEQCGSPGSALPMWIARHAGKANGARGYAIDGLGIPGGP
jgi:hypothetical protein